MDGFARSTRPLIFLMLSSFKNGIIRAFTNVRRLIGLLFFLGYYLLVFIRPFDRSPKEPIPMPGGMSKFHIPDPSSIEPWIFLIFAGLSLILSVSLPSYKSTFRPADVDVLFATPVNPKVVMIWRLVRDYTLTLLMPLFFIIIGWRGANVGLQTLFANFPQYGNYIIRALGGAWILLALAWTCMGYACSLFINRSDQDANRNRLWIYFFAYAPPLVAVLFFAVQMRLNFTGATALATLGSPVLKALFVPAYAATEIVMAPITSNLVLAVGGGLFLIAIIAGSVRIALNQSGWMYDQAAARGFDAVEIRSLARKGDTAGIYALKARSGKIKSGGIASRIAARNAIGGWAILWREAILQFRGNIWSNLFLSVVMTITVGGLAWTAKESRRPDQWLGYVFLGFQFFSTMVVSLATSQQGFIETLRRVDVLKPLPLTPARVVFFEIVGKSIIAPVFTSILGLALIPISPILWDEVLVNFLFLPTVAILISSAVFLVTILFPDVDDPTQRGFRGLISLLAIVIVSSPGLILAGGILFVHGSVFIAGIVAGAVNLGIALGVATIGGNLYAHYNPSE